LIEELRIALDEQSRIRKRKQDDFYILSIAGSSRRQYLLSSKLRYVIDDIDFINVQTFDYRIEILNAGGVSSSAVAGHHTNLYASRMDSWQRRNSDQIIRDYETQGIPMHKLVLGISFHGKGFVNAHDENHGLCQMSDGLLTSDLSYKNIRASYWHQKDYKRYWDKHAKAPYLYSKTEGIFISYDDKRSIRKKTQYVRKHKLGGVLLNSHQEDDGHKLVSATRRGLKRIRLPF
jgi:chitinase